MNKKGVSKAYDYITLSVQKKITLQLNVSVLQWEHQTA